MKHYTVSEFARAIGTSTQYVRQELKLKRIKGTKVGSFWIIDEEEMANNIDKRLNETINNLGEIEI